MTVLSRSNALAVIAICICGTGNAQEFMEPSSAQAESNITWPAKLSPCAEDRIWFLSTRHLSYEACRANLERPDLRMSQLDICGYPLPVTLDEFESKLRPDRQLVVYVHGNRMSSDALLNRAMTVYRRTKTCRQPQSIDWLIFSWPSAKEGFLLSDFREKAGRTDTQGLYLGWFLRRQIDRGVPIVMIGYSYGARVITGALHSVAGGRLGGRSLPGPPRQGANVRLGLVAPAIANDWLSSRGYHKLSTLNLDKFLLLYNSRDAVLKRYWRLDQARNVEALGCSGAMCLGPKADGSSVRVFSRDYAKVVGFHHAELDYYGNKGKAGQQMAFLIDDRLQ